MLAAPSWPPAPPIPDALAGAPADIGIGIGIDIDIDIVENDEPLVMVDDHLPCLRCYRNRGWPGTLETTWLRATVVESLATVSEGLPEGFGLAVFDGWRSMTTIRALYAHYYGPGSTLTPGFLADPDRPGLVPPHLTGGAVDLTLTWNGTALSLGTPFDEFTERARLRYLEADGDSHEPDRSLRRLLHHTMTSQGFAPYSEEWWHFSLGDPDWAAFHGAPTARYGPTAPP